MLEPDNEYCSFDIEMNDENGRYGCRKMTFTANESEECTEVGRQEVVLVNDCVNGDSEEDYLVVNVRVFPKEEDEEEE